ncbi:MAG: VOC family protein, partial [Actinomycetospora chiangmaiensis]|nr:VOC family protein [Actinomycetospora chiangmaiensis]
MPPVEGTPIWFELNATDQSAAQTFYAAVAGWDVAPSPMPEHGGYRVAEADGTPVAGIRQSTPEAPGFPGWAVYLATRDVDALAARVVDLGGHVRFGPVDIPHVGRFAMVSDPQG